MTVYVLQEMGRNIRSAEKFGDLKIVLPDNKQIVLSSGPLTHKLKKELSTFCDDDYLLLIGDPAIIALAGAVASEMNRGKFKILKWDRDEKKYYDIEIDLRGQMNELLKQMQQDAGATAPNSMGKIGAVANDIADTDQEISNIEEQLKKKKDYKKHL